jgi:hypothetical protein
LNVLNISPVPRNSVIESTEPVKISRLLALESSKVTSHITTASFEQFTNALPVKALNTQSLMLGVAVVAVVRLSHSPDPERLEDLHP